MPAVIELRLRAGWPLEATTRQLHGLACAVFEGEHADGHAGGEKPFTVWPLSPDPAAPGTGWLLRTAWLRAGLPQRVLAAYGQLRLGHVTCKVTDVNYGPATHAELAAGPAAEGARLTFRSPTYFSQNGADVVVPDPRLIVGSWRRRWNASLPGGDALTISDDAWREINRAVRLATFDLSTQRMDSGRGHERAGFTGSATLRLDKGAPAETRTQFGALARFAEFCGTGAQTTHGFGATSVDCLPD
jgi:CRISPR-associated endoribonuclease Cas6